MNWLIRKVWILVMDSKEERRNKIMLACQRMASDKEFQSEQVDWDKTVGDGIDSE